MKNIRLLWTNLSQSTQNHSQSFNWKWPSSTTNLMKWNGSEQLLAHSYKITWSQNMPKSTREFRANLRAWWTAWKIPEDAIGRLRINVTCITLYVHRGCGPTSSSTDSDATIISGQSRLVCIATNYGYSCRLGLTQIEKQSVNWMGFLIRI